MFGKLGITLAKHSPTIFVGLGLAGTAVGTVLACKATLKADEVLDKCQEDIQKAPKDNKKETAKAYGRSLGRIARLYGPSVAVYGVSVAGVIFGHRILSKRNLALAAAYTTVNKSFKEYRKKVIEKYGDDDDVEFRNHDIIKQIPFEDLNTKEVTNRWVNAGQLNAYPHDATDTSRFFGPGCINWTKNPEENLLYLKGQEEHANALFDDQGYLFLNDVYAMIGVEPCDLGSKIGWVKGFGDDFIDFGIIRVENYEAVNGWEPVFLLDFNHDGYILNKI